MRPLLSNLLLLLLLAAPVLAAAAAAEAEADKARAKGGVALMHNRLELNSMSFEELDAVFRQGTIGEGLPKGYSYGFVKISEHLPTPLGYAANMLWHGKHFEVTSGKNCPGEDCGQRGTVQNELGTGFMNTDDFMHGQTYIGQFRDIRPDLEDLQLDEKPSVIVDYGNGGGDEIRLVNSKKRIYLGRGSDWGPPGYARIFCYFVLQLFDEPRAVEVSFSDPSGPSVKSFFSMRSSGKGTAADEEESGVDVEARGVVAGPARLRGREQ